MNIVIPKKFVRRSFEDLYIMHTYFYKMPVYIYDLEVYLKAMRKYIKEKSLKNKYYIENYYSLEQKWVDYYFNFIRKKESTLTARFLGKEFLFRRVLLHLIKPSKNILGKDLFLAKLIDRGFEKVIEELEFNFKKYKENCIFNKGKFKRQKYSFKTDYSFYWTMVYSFPYEENLYKIWIKNNWIYNVIQER
jgi:hypothetical protein